MTSFDDIDKALAGGSKAAFTFKDGAPRQSQPGDKVRGPIVNVDYKQTTDYNTGEPAVFPSGDPKMQFVITIQTDQKIDDGDDGQRTVFIPGYGDRKTMLMAAIRECGAAKGSDVLRPGIDFEVEYIGQQSGKSSAGSYTYRAYKYTFRPDAAVDAAADALGGEVISQQAPQPAAVEDLSVAPEGTPAALWSGMTDEQRRAFLVATAKK